MRNEFRTVKNGINVYKFFYIQAKYNKFWKILRKISSQRIFVIFHDSSGFDQWYHSAFFWVILTFTKVLKIYNTNFHL